MPRKINQREIADWDVEIYDEILDVISKTTEGERRTAAFEWCADHQRDFPDFCESKRIRPIGLIAASLMQVEHPICTRANGDFVYEHNLRKFYAQIIKIIVTNESVHIPLCTKREQLAVVHSQAEV